MTGESAYPVVIEFKENNLMDYLKIRHLGGSTEEIKNPANWEIIIINKVNEEDEKKIIEYNKKDKEKWRIGK